LGQLITIFDKNKKKLFRSFDRIFIQKISKEKKLSILEKKDLFHFFTPKKYSH
jgi:hypothetical protein